MNNKRIKNFKLFEFEEKKFDLSPDKISFMDELYQKIKKEIKPNIPDKFNIIYNRGKNITIKTDDKNDLFILIKIKDNKVYYYSKPTHGPEFEFVFDYYKEDFDIILKSIKREFEDDPNKGLSRTYSDDSDTYKFDSDKPSKNIKEEDMDISKPITKKPIRRKRSININIIKNVLEDAFIMDDIDLKDTSVEELIRRMLLESRR